MSYTALYRKFRPLVFDEVKGQEHIVKTLKNQIRTDKVGHAYLFCGTRGTGKTTVAKIFAKAVNCAAPVDGSPCGVCESCKSVASGSSANVIEIDGASHRKIQDARDIIEEMAYRPAEGRYKVYIIDEVHMLTTEAFNALLKTIEEPPEYVIFILATTEAAKIPLTILSRCQRYDFKRMSVDTIVGNIRDILSREGIKAEEEGLRYLARMGSGSMRDSLSLLEECISCYVDEELTYDKILGVLGLADTEHLHRVAGCISAHDVGGCIRAVDDFIKEGKELTYFLSELIWYMRNLLLVKNAEDCEELLDMSSEDVKKLKKISEGMSDEGLLRSIRILSEASGTLRNVVQKRVHVETALIRICMPQTDTDTASLAQRLNLIEEKLQKAELSLPKTSGKPLMEQFKLSGGKEIKAEEKKTEEDKRTKIESRHEKNIKISDMKDKIIDSIESGIVKGNLKNAEMKDDPEMVGKKLYIVFNEEFGLLWMLKHENAREELLRAVENVTGMRPELEFIMAQEKKKEKRTDIPLEEKIKQEINTTVEIS